MLLAALIIQARFVAVTMGEEDIFGIVVREFSLK